MSKDNKALTETVIAWQKNMTTYFPNSKDREPHFIYSSVIYISYMYMIQN